MNSSMADRSASNVKSNSSENAARAGVGTSQTEKPTAQPVLPKLAPQENQRMICQIRAFHLSGVRPQLGLREGQRPDPEASAPPRDLFPLSLLARGEAADQATYPLFLVPSQAGVQVTSVSVGDLLSQLCPAKAKLLQQHLAQYEACVRQCAETAADPTDVKALLRQAKTDLQKQVGLDAAHSEALAEQVETLVEKVAADTVAVRFAADADIAMLRYVAVARQKANAKRVAEGVDALIAGLDGLLRVDELKQVAEHHEVIGRNLGPISALIDTKKMAGVVGQHRGTGRLPNARRDRVRRVVAVLKAYRQRFEPRVLLFSDAAVSEALGKDDDVLVIKRVENAVQAAAERFDELAREYVGVVRAMRTAALELQHPAAYDESFHDEWLAGLTWRDFSRDELALLPAIVALTCAGKDAAQRPAEIIAAISSGRPIRTMMRMHTGSVAAAPLELGLVAAAQRRALVWQSATSEPTHLVHGLDQAFEQERFALCIVRTLRAAEGATVTANDVVRVAAAVAGRAHPVFNFSPDGRGWRGLIQLDCNPDPSADWPQTQIDCSNGGKVETLTVPITCADGALLDSALVDQLLVVPDSCGKGETLVPIAEYLALPATEAALRVPFVWAVDAKAQMIRVAMTAALANVCRERLDFWRSLKDLAGAAGAGESVSAQRAQTDQAAGAEQESAPVVDERELAKIRKQAVSDAMQRVARALVGLDGGAAQLVEATAAKTEAVNAEAAKPAAGQPAAGKASEGEKAAVVAPSTGGSAVTNAAAEEEAPEEPWVDSMLCTSCNDCVNLNARLFVYDDNKQVTIGDPKAGSFAQLVAAAEACPAQCIHPGQPLDPSEANLDDLRERAKRFN